MRLLPSLLLVVLVSTAASAQSGGAADPHTLRTGRAFEAARKQGSLALHNFLVGMPKGADLHVHLSGAVYAESWIRAAGEDGLCIDPAALDFAKPVSGKCVKGEIAAADLLNQTQAPAAQGLYDKLINAFSMRSFVAYQGWSGHDQFFSTFDHFGGTDKRHTGEWIDEIVSRAAAQNEQYVELMDTPPFGHAAELGHTLGWNTNMADLRKKLLDGGLDEEVSAAKERIDSALVLRDKLEHCSTPEAAPACKVQVRFIYQILRGAPPEQVFAQTLLGFEAISKLPEFVGINFVQPEDGHISMTDYTLQMHMLDYLHSVYPSVHITLHAGELAPGMVPPEGLRFHIRQAVDLGHAERIGHGVDVMYEDNPEALLKELATKHIMVEINLTSNDGILGIKGLTGEHAHPLPYYRKAGVPVALSTDDEGVSRIDLTHEYTRAAEEYSLSYADLKQMARTGMEHDFLPGKSLWAQADKFTAPVSACRTQVLGAEKPAAACKTFLDSSEKATAQWEQERRFREFEAKW
ncbi:adenosine deaminase family protein [Acidicapsa ligni]|uniref:adenosine deaminase family protein n=1 Tax=Acidicapsa ligni TaxID=542300 RepID=UPI0021E0BC25|nr:adenosine deaminase [Acidicapsa ligni]